jgi:hypothetical protein
MSIITIRLSILVFAFINNALCVLFPGDKKNVEVVKSYLLSRDYSNLREKFLYVDGNVYIACPYLYKLGLGEVGVECLVHGFEMCMILNLGGQMNVIVNLGFMKEDTF